MTASVDGSLRVWRVNQPGSRALVESGRVLALRLDGDRALVRTPQEVAWWNVSSGQRVPIFSWTKQGVAEASVSPGGEHLFVPDADGSAEIRHRAQPPTQLRGHSAAILQSQWSRDGKYLFTASRDGTLRRWDVANGQGAILSAGSAPLRSFAVAADGRVAWTRGDTTQILGTDGTARVIDVGPDFRAAQFEPVNDRLMLWSLQRFAVVEGERVIELPTDHHWAVRFSVSPDGTRGAAGLGDRTIRVWELATGRVLDVLRGHTDLVLDVAFSPDGKLLASSSYDTTVRIWQLGTPWFRVLYGHSAPVTEIEWKQPKRIVTGSTDATLRVWDVPSLELPSAYEIENRLKHVTTARISLDRPTTIPKSSN